MKSKRSKALNFTPKVRQRIIERDNGRCIFCGELAVDIMHLIGKGKGGLGIEQNGALGCRSCHDRYDRGTRDERAEMQISFLAHQRIFYPELDLEDLYYKKFKNMERKI